MDGLLFVLFLLVPAFLFFALLTVWLIGRFYHVPYHADALYWATTADGWKLALHRRIPETRRFKQPVILCHGLGANRFNLDFPGHSLAEYLNREGFDVWVCELRGAGYSSTPAPFSRYRYDWNFDTLVRRDIPAVIGRICELTGCADLLWVGHSMGGMVMYAHLAEADPRVKAVFAIASPVTFDELTWSAHVRPIGRLLSFLPAFHQRFWATLMAPLSGRFGGKPGIISNDANVDMPFGRHIMPNLSTDLPMTLVMHTAKWSESGQLVSADGACNYYERMAEITTPMGFAVGAADRLATPKSVRDAFERCGSADKTFRFYSKADGDQADYGHGDIVFGRSAPDEVFTHVAEFLEKRAERLSQEPDAPDA